MTTTLIPPAYDAAVRRLLEAHRDLLAQAEALDYFADVARGQRPDPEGPPLEALPSPRRLRRLLERRFEAFADVEAGWGRLSADEREAAPPPDDLLAGGWVDA